MWNVHALAHRLTAVSVSCLATAGFVFGLLGGFSCDYVKVHPMPERVVVTPNGLEYANDTSASIGVQCDTPFYTEGDRLWNMSQIFLYVGLGLGGLTTLLAWTLCVFVPPSNFVWRSISILAACAAVVEVPIFLLFESLPCKMDISRQTCSVSIGAYFNIASIALFVVMTLWTQCLRPPDWTKETDAWRNTDRDFKIGEITIPSGGESREGNGTEEESATRDTGTPPLVVSRGSQPCNPPHWDFQSKRSDPVPLDEPRRLARGQELHVEQADDNHVFHHWEVTPLDDESRQAELMNDKNKQTEGNYRSLWGILKGSDSKKLNGHGNGLSAWVLGTRRNDEADKHAPNDEEVQDEESGEVETLTATASKIRDIQLIEELPLGGPASVENTAPAVINRETSIFDPEAEEDEDDEEGIPYEQEERVNDEEDSKEAALVMSSLKEKPNSGRGSMLKSHRRNKAHGAAKKKKRGIKVTIIGPDGSREDTKVGGARSVAVENKEQPETVIASKDSWMENPPLYHATSEEKPTQLGPRDVILTHVIPSYNNRSTEDEHEESNPSKLRTSQILRREVSEEKDYPSHARSSPLQIGRGRSKEPSEAPVESLSIPPRSQSLSYDVSEMTPGPEAEMGHQDTKAILEDLARFEQ